MSDKPRGKSTFFCFVVKRKEGFFIALISPCLQELYGPYQTEADAHSSMDAFLSSVERYTDARVRDVWYDAPCRKAQIFNSVPWHSYAIIYPAVSKLAAFQARKPIRKSSNEINAYHAGNTVNGTGT